MSYQCLFYFCSYFHLNVLWFLSWKVFTEHLCSLSAHRESVSRIVFLPSISRGGGTGDTSTGSECEGEGAAEKERDGSIVTISRDGLICFWKSNMTLQRMVSVSWLAFLAAVAVRIQSCCLWNSVSLPTHPHTHYPSRWTTTGRRWCGSQTWLSCQTLTRWCLPSLITCWVNYN